MYNPYRLIIAFFVLCTLPGTTTWGQQENPTEAAQRAVRQLSAVRALQSRLEQFETYKASQNNLAAIIKEELTGHRSSAQPGSDGPGLEKARTELRKSYPTIYSQAIQEIVDSLDPEKKFRLSQWLKDYGNAPQAGQKVSLNDKGQKLHDEYLATKEFGSLYAAARKQVVEEQVREIRPGSGEDSFPTVKEVERVYSQPTTRAEVIANGKRSLIGQQPLLDEAEQAVEDLAAKLLANGLEQLEEQHRVLEQAVKSDSNRSKPRVLTAHTREGMEKALEEALRTYRGTFKPPPGFKAYKGFSLVNARLKQLAREEIDKRIVQSTGNLLAQMADGKLRIAEPHKEKILTRMVNSPNEHHTLKGSKSALEPLILEGILQMRERIWGSLANDAESKPAKDLDPADVRQVLRREVEERVETKDAPPEKEWKKLSDRVRAELEALVVAARKEIAEKQAADLCPVLGKGDWKPDEKLILALDPKDVDARSISGFDIWKGQPPVKTKVLEETWDLWIQKARDMLALGREALNQQRSLVGELERHVVPQIRKTPKGGTTYWANVYTQRVAARWREDPSPAASQYKELFKATLSEIDRVVGEALHRKTKEVQTEMVEERRSEIEGRIRQERTTTGKPPVFQPHYDVYLRLITQDWKKHELSTEHPDLVPETVRQMRGIVQESVRAQIEILEKNVELGKGILEKAKAELQAGAQDPKKFRERLEGAIKSSLGDQVLAPDMQKALKHLEEQAEALYRQNQLVDETKPGIEAEISKSIRTGGSPKLETWETAYVQRVESGWKGNELSKKKEFEKLLPAVRERIHGIVVDLVKTQQANIRDRILTRQLEHVNRYEQQFQTQIKCDPKPERKAYEARYTDLVKKDWQNSEQDRELRQLHPELMQETIDQIRGKVTKFILESPRPSPAETEPVRPRSPGVAPYDTKGAQKGELAKGSQTGDTKGTTITGEFGGDTSSGTGTSSGSGGADHGKGGSVSPHQMGGDAMVPHPEQKKSNIPWWLLIVLIICLMISLYSLYRWYSRRGAGNGQRDGRGVGQGYGFWYSFFWWMSLQPLFWQFVKVYGKEARGELRSLIERKKAIPRPNAMTSPQNAEGSLVGR